MAVAPRLGGFELEGKLEEGAFIADAGSELGAIGRPLPAEPSGTLIAEAPMALWSGVKSAKAASRSMSF